ncbi:MULTISPECIES: head-tail connector protein [unclassified Roseovarius]|uniref:head-tail connector protein n=1 Tax=unclassified Roseovarius TaxID=2614913 RepID=UPI00273E0CAE|nr:MULTISPECIES: head-tail connector protein [unclassified Roseovarius]
MNTTQAEELLPLLKSQLNLDHDLDDALLTHKLRAAGTWIENFVGGDFLTNDPIMTEAALQLAAYWYEQREAAADQRLLEVPFGVHELLNRYRRVVTGRHW